MYATRASWVDRNGGRAPASRLCHGIAILAIGFGSRAHATCCEPEVAASTAWEVPSPGAGFGPQAAWLATDSVGGVHVMWGSPFESPHFSSSWDDGQTWSPRDNTLTGTAETIYVRADVEPGGNLILAYRDGDGVFARQSSDQGRTHAPAIRLATIGGSADRTQPFVRFGPGGLAVIAWSDADYPDIAPSDGIWSVASTDYGRTWSAPVRLSDGPAAAPQFFWGVRLVVSDVAIVVGWIDYRTGTEQELHSRSTDGGRTWSANVPFLPPFTGERQPLVLELARTSGSHMLAEIVRAGGVGLNSPLRFAVSNDDGASWQDSGFLGLVSRNYTSTHWTSLPDGRVHAAWLNEYEEVRTATSVAHGDPGTWVASTGVPIPGGAQQHGVQIVEWIDQSLVVAAEDYRLVPTCDSCESIYLDRSCDGGATWLTDALRLDDDAPPQPPHSEYPLLAVSPAGRLHALWSDDLLAGSTSAIVTHAAFEQPSVPELVVMVSDLRTSGCDLPVYRFDASVTWSGSCNNPTYQWFVDGVAIPGATAPTWDLPASTPPGPHEIEFELTCRPKLVCGGLSPAVTVDVQGTVVEPRIVVTEDPVTGCARPRQHLSCEPGLLGLCASLGYEWHEDGAILPGATSAVYDVPPDETPGMHDFEVVVTCNDAPACSRTSGIVTVDVTPPVSGVTGLDLAGILRVARSPAQALLTWTDTASAAEGYSLLAGSIGSWYDHAALACGVPRVPLTAPSTATAVAMPPVNTYYLVAPADCAGEGQVGSDSFGTLRPLVGRGAACGPIR